MKRIVCLTLGLALTLLLSGCETDAPAQPSEAAALRYDGLYCYIMDFDNNGLTNNYALRFYEDGVVIHTSVEQRKPNGNYFPTGGWFGRENEYYKDLLGHYEFVDGAITLTTFNTQGSVDYQGTVLPDKLVLNSHSNINGYELKNCQYVFYPFDELP